MNLKQPKNLAYVGVLLVLLAGAIYASITVFNEADAKTEINNKPTVISIEQNLCETYQPPDKTVTTIPEVDADYFIEYFSLEYTVDGEQRFEKSSFIAPKTSTKEQLYVLVSKACHNLLAQIKKQVSPPKEVRIIYPDLLAGEIYDLDTKTWSQK